MGLVMASEASAAGDAHQQVGRANIDLEQELAEAHRREGATAEVLKAISRSTFKLQDVLDSLIKSAVQLTGAETGIITKQDGEVYRVAAIYGASPEFIETARQNPIPQGRQSATGRAVLERRVVHIHDVLDDREYTWVGQQRAGVRTILAVPMLKEETVIGVIGCGRREVRPFTAKQIELVQTFADQAVIAIENTRLFEEVQVRNRELSERTHELQVALDQQTATAEILRVISSSLGRLEPVFEAVLANARRLCGANFGQLFLYKDGYYHAVALHNLPPAFAEFLKRAPINAGPGTALGRITSDRKIVHIIDITDDQVYRAGDPLRRATADLGGVRTFLGVPLTKGKELVGAFFVYRKEVNPFTDAQIELLAGFADQAIIAIENARLLEEVQARTRELARTVEQLEIASQHKSQFVANMSHELRTPLAAILGYAELLQEGFYGSLPEKSMAALTRIRSNGKHLLGLINTVLDVAKIESGQFALNMAEYDIESMVETVRSATESLAQNKKLGLKTEVTNSLPIGLGDEQRLTQVLLNLVGNAIKFTDTGEVRVTATAINGHFNVSVIDTGPGIPADQLTRIFEQFHQVDSSNTKAKGGTGLGLAIARQIVEMHGGRIWVDSTLGKGAAFQMQLPIRAEARKGIP
jgi:signal transduction histidine kinase